MDAKLYKVCKPIKKLINKGKKNGSKTRYSWGKIS